MGLFTLAVAGGGFIFIGAWEAFNFSTQNPNQISLQSSPFTSSQTPSPSSTSATHKNPSSSSSISFFVITIFSCLFILNSIFSFFDAVNSRDPVGTALQLQVLAIASLFLLYGLVGLLVNSSISFPIPSLLLNLIGLFAFIVEFLLFYLQRKDPSGIENRYFDLLLVPITVCIFSTILDLKTPNSNFPKFSRGVGLILQGMWFLQMGLSFYTKNFVAHGCSLHQKSRGNYTIKCKGHPEYHRARAIATLQFNCHLALLVILVACMYSILARRNGGGDFMHYKPIVAEMQPFENQGQFTLDSDDGLGENIKEEDNVVKHIKEEDNVVKHIKEEDNVMKHIKEEDNVVKHKAAVGELGVNGHASH